MLAVCGIICKDKGEDPDAEPIQQNHCRLLACSVCGLSVGIMWPGSFSKAASALPKGGTAMFALLALAGDVGCAGGPTLVGMVSSAQGDNLKLGIAAGIFFPALLLAGIAFLQRKGS